MDTNRTILACLCAILAVSGGAAAENRERARGDGQQARFNLYHNYLIVLQGTIGKLGKRNILLDTGTNPITIDEKLARKLGLKDLSQGAGAMHVLTGNVATRFVKLDTLQLGPIRREGIPAVVADLSMFQRQEGVHIDAVVGLQVFGGTSFRVDYEARRITFGPLDADPASVPFASGPPFVTVPLTVKGQPMRMLVDTGTAGLVLFSNRAGEWQRALPVITEQQSSNVGGQATMRQVQLGGVEMGRTALGPGPAFLVESHCCNFDGLLGISRVRMKEIAFDFERGVFLWRAQPDDGPRVEVSSQACDTAAKTGLESRTASRQDTFAALVDDEDGACDWIPRKPASAR